MRGQLLKSIHALFSTGRQTGKVLLVGTTLNEDLIRLDSLAFKRSKRVGTLIEAVHACFSKGACPDLQACLGIVRSWLLVPYTLWPIDFASLGWHLVDLHQQGNPVSADLKFTLERVRSLPSEEEQESVAAYERLVEKGRYEEWLKPKARKKFLGEQRRLMSNPAFNRDWCDLKTLFQEHEPRLGKELVRRLLCRNLFPVRASGG